MAQLEELGPHQNVGDVRGKGLMLMVEVVKDKESKESFTQADDAGPRLAQAVRKHGIIPFASEKGIMLSPPLTATREDVDQIADAVRRSIVEVFG
ncbi:MAG: aminotransferase class III-fold pyridoxal phosphate-dependent enzyme [Thermomicrobiales bacterium]